MQDNEVTRVNRQIYASAVRVINDDGTNLGVMSSNEALKIAQSQGLDLVEVSPSARPPVCKIMDYGKFRYHQSKKVNKAKKIETKTIKFGATTEEHDLNLKARQANSFLEKGHNVKFILKMKGREQSHVELWFNKLNEFSTLIENGKLTSPKHEGRTIVMTATPNPVS